MKKKPAKSPAASNSPDVTVRLKSTAVKQSGLNTRVRGHLKAANQRSQSKRDHR